jgi:thiamine biosynthesis protein ThiS
MIRVIVNGKPRELPGPMTVAEFLAQHNINPATVAVELRGDIVRREHYATTVIQDGDRLEIVRMIGGGAV